MQACQPSLHTLFRTALSFFALPSSVIQKHWQPFMMAAGVMTRDNSESQNGGHSRESIRRLCFVPKTTETNARGILFG